MQTLLTLFGGAYQNAGTRSLSLLAWLYRTPLQGGEEGGGGGGRCLLKVFFFIIYYPLMRYIIEINVIQDTLFA